MPPLFERALLHGERNDHKKNADRGSDHGAERTDAEEDVEYLFERHGAWVSSIARSALLQLR